MAPPADEVWQAYNEQGEPTFGEGVARKDYAQGRTHALHAAAHLWIWRGDHNATEILLQKRALDQYTWPGYLDISSAGHVDLNEAPLQTAIREAKEELGLDINPAELHLLFVHRQQIVVPPHGIFENEWQWVYGIKLNGPVSFKHDHEVESTIWLKIPEFEALIKGKTTNQIAPHGDAYFTMLLRSIQLGGKE